MELSSGVDSFLLVYDTDNPESSWVPRVDLVKTGVD